MVNVRYDGYIAYILHRGKDEVIESIGNRISCGDGATRADARVQFQPAKVQKIPDIIAPQPPLFISRPVISIILATFAAVNPQRIHYGIFFTLLQ